MTQTPTHPEATSPSPGTPAEPVTPVRLAAADGGTAVARAERPRRRRRRSRPAPGDGGGGAVGGTVSRRAVAGAGLAGVGLLAACRLPGDPLTPGAPPSPSPSGSAAPSPVPSPSASSALPPPTATATATATAMPSAAPPPPGSTPGAVEPDAALLARRAAYGPTGQLLADIEAVGVMAWIDTQLDPSSVPDPDGDRIDAAYPDLFASPAELRDRLEGPGGLRSKLQGHHLARAVYSSRQLYEVAVDFFSNHLNINVNGDGQQMWTRPDYQTSVIRAHALGRFEDMLHASGIHPAMLDYLDNESSRRDAINENYARELLELHTVGVDGGYTEEEIQALARLLTGWVADRDEGWAVRNEPDRHQVGAETVLGQTFANDSAGAGPAVWDEVVAFLARHPTTAQYLATKLARHFVADEPSTELVQRLAQVYLDSDTAIAPVLRALLTSPEFASSAGQKVRRPYERYVATLRLAVSGVPDDVEESMQRLVRRLVAHKPLAWAPPDGYPDVAAEWQSPGDALDLFNKTAELLRGRPDIVPLDAVDRILAAGPTTFAGVVDAAAEVLLLRPASDAERAAGVSLLGSGSLAEPLQVDSGPQRRAAEIAGTLLLTSTDHLLR